MLSVLAIGCNSKKDYFTITPEGYAGKHVCKFASRYFSPTPASNLDIEFKVTKDGS